MKYMFLNRSSLVKGMCAFLLLGTFVLHAQLSALTFSGSAGKKNSKDDTPTVVNSDAMDMDLANDKIILLGNVDVQDKDMNIKCRKMIIYLGKTQKTGNAAAKPAEKTKKKSSGTEQENSGKSVQKIECIGDVVITQKQNSGAISQQAFAGKAVYFALEEKIILTESPVVVKDGNRLEGENITLYTETDRVLVVKPVSTFRGQAMGGRKSK